MKPAVPPKPKPKNNNFVQNENIDTSTGFSVSAAKALFEAAKKPEVRNAAIAAAKNPFVRQTAKTVAQDEKARGAVLNAVKDPSASNKFSVAFAVADANSNNKSSSSSSSSSTSAPPPPPPPHRGTSSTDYSSIARSATSKLSGAHAAIRSQLENLHLGGGGSAAHSAPTPKPAESAASYSYQKPGYSSSSSSAAPPLPPPLPSHSSSSSSTNHPTASFSSYGSSSGGYSQTPSGPHGIAQYSYSAVQSDEISLNIGDTVVLKKEVDDQWIYGENQRNGQNGIVPISYLQIVIPLPKAMPNSSQIFAQALYDYNSMQPGDLVFSANQSIVVTGKINDEWLEGVANGQKGIFPSNFVSCDRLYEVPMKIATSSSSSSYTSSAPAPAQAQNSAVPETVTVNYDYDSGISGDLRCSAGDLITIIENVDAQWIMAELRGNRGLVPKSFLGPPFGSPKKISKGIAEISSAFSPKKAIATGDYHSEDPKHLYVTRGDSLLIVEDVDEYYYRGKLEAFKTLPAGILPKNVVKFSN